MNLSSNSLFHFTPKIEYLKDILLNGFWPRYCKEYGWGSSIDFALPMVCFCDIPLSLIEDHTNFYGCYGIGLKRNWATKLKQITPVQYVNYNSHLGSYIRRLLTKLKNNNLTYPECLPLYYAKKISGEVKNKKGKQITKSFYNEHEWRYIPKDLNQVPLLPLEKGKEQDLIELSKTIDKVGFDKTNIQYIIVPTAKKREELIQFIFNNYNKDEGILLISKIMVLDQIKKDF